MAGWPVSRAGASTGAVGTDFQLEVFDTGLFPSVHDIDPTYWELQGEVSQDLKVSISFQILFEKKTCAKK
jgi:hypothetical protein